MLTPFAKRTLLSALLCCASVTAHAWPDKPVTVVVPWPAGGPSDIAARPIAKGLSEALKQPFVIDNRAGAGGNIGTALVARSPADGHTLLITASGPIVINQHLYKKMPFDAETDLQPVTNLLRVPQVLVVHPSVPANTLQELLALIKSRNGEFQWASAGNGTTQHMTGAMLQQRTGLSMVHIPYKGSAPAITDLIGGQVPMLIDSTIAVMPMIKSGKAKAIVVTGKTRVPNLPQVPTAAESGLPGFESYAWYGMFAPVKTPKPVIDQLNQATVAYMRHPDFQRVIQETGSDFVGSDPASFARFVKEDEARWNVVAPKLNLSLD